LASDPSPDWPAPSGQRLARSVLLAGATTAPPASSSSFGAVAITQVVTGFFDGIVDYSIH